MSQKFKLVQNATGRPTLRTAEKVVESRFKLQAPPVAPTHLWYTPDHAPTPVTTSQVAGYGKQASVWN